MILLLFFGFHLKRIFGKSSNEDCDKIMKDFEKVQAQWLAQVYSQNSYGGVILIGVLIVIAIIVYYIVKKRRNKSKQ